jgi:hypothetical protein
MAKQKSLKAPMKLTESNYYSLEADKAYMSVSQFKSFLDCEARTMAKLNGEYVEEGNNTALLVGSYVDSSIEGTLDKFKEENPQIFTQKGELKADFKKAEEIVRLIEENELFQKFLSGEKQVILIFELFGIWWKIKMDSFVRDICITDLKTARNTEGIVKWRYDYQGTIYQKGVELNGLGTLPFYLAVATKEDIPDLNIFQIPQSTLDLALMEVEENLPHIIEVKSGKIAPTRCEKCDYCKKTRQVRIRNYNELLE